MYLPYTTVLTIHEDRLLRSLPETGTLTFQQEHGTALRRPLRKLVAALRLAS